MGWAESVCCPFTLESRENGVDDVNSTWPVGVAAIVIASEWGSNMFGKEQTVLSILSLKPTKRNNNRNNKRGLKSAKLFCFNWIEKFKWRTLFCRAVSQLKVRIGKKSITKHWRCDLIPKNVRHSKNELIISSLLARDFNSPHQRNHHCFSNNKVYHQSFMWYDIIPYLKRLASSTIQ